MVFEFKLPDIGEGVHEGEIAKWMVEEGKPVQEDDPMVEVMTDKVTVVITAPVSGIVASIHVEEGTVAHVGDVIITINDTGGGNGKSTAKAAEPEAANQPVAASAATVGSSAYSSAPSSAPVLPARSSGASDKVLAANSDKVLAAPAVRKLARTMGVDLALVQGSGPKGRIRKPDVEAFAGGGSAMAAPQKAVSTVSFPKPAAVGLSDKRIPYTGIRRKIGDHLVHSKHTAPHFTYVEEADLTQLVQMRADLEQDAAAMGATKLTYLPFIIKAVIQGMKHYPILNSTLDEEKQEIFLKGDCNMGVAVATEQGLVVPVIHKADQLSLIELAQAIVTLSQKARNNQLSLQDIQGGTFTLTSIGSIGGIFSAPIINYPEVAIMGIQKIEKRPVVRDDQIVIREMTYLSISCDHRVVDGAEAALFMKEVIGWLEQPSRLLLS